MALYTCFWASGIERRGRQRTAYKKLHHSVPEVRTYGDECWEHLSKTDHARNRRRRSNMVGRASALLQPGIILTAASVGGDLSAAPYSLAEEKRGLGEDRAAGASTKPTLSSRRLLYYCYQRYYTAVCEHHIRKCCWPRHYVHLHIIYCTERRHVSTWYTKRTICRNTQMALTPVKRRKELKTWSLSW